MKLNIDDEDFGTLCIDAIRYSMGRQTYMPDLVRSIVTPHLKKLTDKTLSVMIEDCEFQARHDIYGDERIDKPGWLKWHETLLNEKRRRGNDENLF